MTIILLLFLYMQFVNEYIFQLPRNPYFTYIITVIIFGFVLMFFFQKLTSGKIDKLMIAYFICLPLVLINESFIASINIFGFALYLRNKEVISIEKLGKTIFIINLIVIIILAVRIYENNELVRVWGQKLGRDIIVYGFNNPNTQAEFFYFCALGVWLAIKNKYLRNILVVIIALVAYHISLGRTYLLATISLSIVDFVINAKLFRYYKFFLVVTPIMVTIMMFVFGYLTRGLYVGGIIDSGVAGRLFFSGYIMGNLDLFRFFLGFSNIMTYIILDVSTFAIFATRGMIMLIFMLYCYIKYVRAISSHHYRYFPAIVSSVMAGITLPMLAWFSINMIIFLCLLEHARKINHSYQIDITERVTSEKKSRALFLIFHNKL